MISDPCNATLTPGLYGSEVGILGKYKSSHFDDADANENGFFLWCPTYYGTTYSAGNTMNCLFFSTATGSTALRNSAANPLGSGTTGSTARQVGASSFISGSTCQDFRTLSACLRLIYTGSTANCKGRVAVLDNIPVNLLMADSTLTINGLFSYAASTERTSLDLHEVTYRPSDSSSKMRNDDAGLMIANFGAQTSLTETSANEAPVFIGFAWRGVPVSSLAFECIQNIEWRPDMNVGYVEPPIKQSSEEHVTRALSWLDANYPEWSTKANHILARGLQTIGDYVLGGPPQRMRIRM